MSTPRKLIRCSLSALSFTDSCKDGDDGAQWSFNLTLLSPYTAGSGTIGTESAAGADVNRLVRCCVVSPRGLLAFVCGIAAALASLSSLASSWQASSASSGLAVYLRRLL
ncbi:hypothetical protein JOB18_001725 [Solea senegalensis]|uniref:Uncharacterized protein n=1 Tax=Solea senegalensis TaxID=28829 RepID=A0AAV6R0X5_SOLSE|nr:hypothetical protein JOB18_001725 [Solea senegalensis]